MTHWKTLAAVALISLVSCAEDGAAGPPGADGEDGTDGMDGADGMHGMDGADGTDGMDGQPGTDGAACWDANGDGTCQSPDEDLNSDGVCDTLDCQGTDGADGAQGPQGPPGDTGPQGPAGPTLFKRTTFSFVSILAEEVTLASLTFTPPAAGTAVLRSRGYCNLGTNTSDNGINIAAGDGVSSPFTGSVTDMGVMRVPANATPGLRQQGWTSETTLAVAAGVPVTRVLVGKHEIGNAPANCSGSFTVEIYTGTLP